MSDAEPRVGRQAPEFALPSQTGETVRLADFRGKKNVVLYFYPKDDTPGCTREACDFRDALPGLGRKDVVVLGVSKDGVASHEKFASKYELPFPLLSDAQGDVAERYGVWKEKTHYGRTALGIERTTFLIDKEGVLRKVFPKVRVEGHVDEIAAALDELG
ncbi:MAG TPA: thioredoxin-dependent thiol peroxidase [Gemmatimonadota bacterium]|jgi:peroxiredoxin Q/BCP